MNGASVWWSRRKVWLPPVLLLALNVALFLGYELAVAGKLGIQVGALADRRHVLQDLSGRRREREQLAYQARTTRAAVDHLYGDRLGSQASRLTAIMLEVKRLARQAGLAGVDAISYQDEQVKDVPLVKKTIGFAATGTYEQLRAFINLLELSPSFLTLEEIRVQEERGQGQLQLSFKLSTLFFATDEGRPQA